MSTYKYAVNQRGEAEPAYIKNTVIVLSRRLEHLIVHLKLKHARGSIGFTFAADKTGPDHYRPS